MKTKIVFSVLSLLVFISGILIIKARQESKLEQRLQMSNSIQSMKRKMLADYAARGEIIKGWISSSSLQKDPEIHSLLVENAGLHLHSKAEFSRFDWVQEKLNQKISILLSEKLSKKDLKEIISIERDILKSRAEFSSKVIEANGTGMFDEKFPLFYWEESTVATAN